jgi:hypothetical protein
MSGPAPIPAVNPYFLTRCEHCGWEGSSGQCSLARNWDDADVVCPSCDRIFLCDEVLPAVWTEICTPPARGKPRDE